ncbi:histidine ammonia-lyase [Candidatus Acetothermia bacterium]|nr:histidine ammonia-lyase [Candidatus Acetothermia bacterium]
MIELDGHSLTLEHAEKIVFAHEKIQLSPAALERVEASQRVVQQIVDSGQRAYGINTGFGKLSTQVVPREKLEKLQENLIRSHSAGVGEPLPKEVARAALLFRVNALAQGRSGVRSLLLSYLVRWLNEEVYPLIPSKGSVGSSGDLAPLAHLALLLLGEGEAIHKNEHLHGSELLRKLNLEPLKLGPKEGLALINGTQITLGLGFVGLVRALKLLDTAQAVAALSLEAARANTAAFDERLHRARPHAGQIAVATKIREWLQGSRLVNGATDVQDPYSLRCIPQVLGASADALQFVKEKIEIEMNSATDNPLIFAETGDVLSGGNFHGQILALVMELLGIAVAEVGNIAERRIALLLEAPGLPQFLIQDSGLNSGLMVPQYTAAALVVENKVLAHPSAVDSIPTSGGKEDHNSMAATSAHKALKIIENVEYIIAIELMTACQALDFRDVLKMAPYTRRLHARCREKILHLHEDRILQQDIEMALQLVQGGKLIDGV